MEKGMLCTKQIVCQILQQMSNVSPGQLLPFDTRLSLRKYDIPLEIWDDEGEGWIKATIFLFFKPYHLIHISDLSQLSIYRRYRVGQK